MNRKMSDRQENYKCPHCGAPLTWADTMYSVVDIDEQNFRVREIYCCDSCGKDWNIFFKGSIKVEEEKFAEA